MRRARPRLWVSPSRAAERRVRAAQGRTRWSKDDQAVRRCAPHIGGAEAGRHPQSIGSLLRRGTISVSSRKQGALSADHHIKKEVQMTKAKDAAALRLAPLDTPTDLRANAVPEISG